MKLRHVMTAPLALAGALALAAPGAQAEVLVRDTGIDRVRALDDLVLYHRTGDGPDHRRVVDGRRRAANGVPARALASGIGRDAAGRVVVAMSVTTMRGNRVIDRDWWLYDVRRDTARPLAGVPASADAASVWRGRVAYSVTSTSDESSGVFLQEGGRTRRVIAGTPVGAPLHLRGRALHAILDDRLGSTAVHRLAAGAKRAVQLPGSYTTGEWAIGALGTSGRTVTWAVAPRTGVDPGGVVGVRLDRSGDPGQPGAVPVADLPEGRLRAWALDGRRLYTADRKALHRNRVAKAPESAAPANDDVADATPIGTDPPIALTPIVGNATTEEGEPVEDAVWFEFKPTVTQRVALRAGSSGFRSFVFEGDALGSLKEVDETRTDDDTRFDVVAGRTYSIAVAGPPLGGDYEFARYVPFRLQLEVVD